jgi:hypothetical protein
MMSIFGLVIFFVFNLWYLLLGGCCRAQEARRSRAFVTATHVHYRSKRYTCGCLCGGEEMTSVPLLNVVDVLSDASWWALMDNIPCGGCLLRPCCAEKVPNADCMLLGVVHRSAAGSDDRRSANKKRGGGIIEICAVEDPITFQQVLQAAVALRQEGELVLRSKFNDVLSNAVMENIAPGNADEQDMARSLTKADPVALIQTMMQISQQSSSFSRVRYPKLNVAAALSSKLGINPGMMMMGGGRVNPHAMLAMQQQAGQGHASAQHGAVGLGTAPAAYPGAGGAYGSNGAYPGMPPTAPSYGQV